MFLYTSIVFFVIVDFNKFQNFIKFQNFVKVSNKLKNPLFSLNYFLLVIGLNSILLGISCYGKVRY